MSVQKISNVEYATQPQFDVAHGVALGVAIVSAVPAEAPADIKAAAGDVRTATAALQASWRKRLTREPNADTRGLDNRVDRAWSSLEKVLDATREVPRSDRAPLAAKVYQRLFSEGLSFLQLKYPAQWSACKVRLDALSEGSLEADLNTAVGGPEFLSEVRAAQAAYGAALGIEAPKEQPESVNLSDSLSELRGALENYVAELVVWSRRSESNLAPARAALVPIDARRAAAAAASASKKTETPPANVSPDTPIPAVP